MEKKRCNSCKRVLPILQFAQEPKRSSRRFKLTCKRCEESKPSIKTPLVVFTEEEIEEGKRRDKNYHVGLKRRYNLTYEQSSALWYSQNGICPICKNDLVRPHVDHSHVTGKVRGMLCIGCNTRLGWVEKVGIEAILEYLYNTDETYPRPNSPE